jgi:hypothetical protein
MSLSEDINAIHERATKFIGGYEETHYVNGDSDETLTTKKALNAKKIRYINAHIQTTVADTMMALVDITNGQGNDVLVQGMLDGMHRSHRYLQSEFIKDFLPEFLKKYGSTADDAMFTDGRNQFAKKLASKMAGPHH